MNFSIDITIANSPILLKHKAAINSLYVSQQAHPEHVPTANSSNCLGAAPALPPFPPSNFPYTFYDSPFWTGNQLFEFILGFFYAIAALFIFIVYLYSLVFVLFYILASYALDVDDFVVVDVVDDCWPCLRASICDCFKLYHL